MKVFKLLLFFFICACTAYGQSIINEDALAIRQQENLARAKMMQGNYEEAQNIYEELFEKVTASNSILLFRPKLNYTSLLLTRGFYKTAEEYLNNIEEPSVNQLKNELYLEKAKVALYLEDYQKARSFLRRIDLSRQLNSEFLVEFYTDLAYLEFTIGEYAESINHYESCLEFDMGLQRYYILSNLALAYAYNNNSGLAIKSIDECLQNLRKNITEYARCLRKKGEIYLLLDQKDSAFIAFKEYIALEKRQVVQLFPNISEQERLDYWKNRKPLLSEPFCLEGLCPNFLFDLSLFRRQIALLGRNDFSLIKKKVSYIHEDIGKRLQKTEVAIEFVKYKKNENYRYAAILLSGESKKVNFISLWSEDSIKTYNIGGNRLDSALCSKIRLDKDKVYQNEALSSYVWDKLLPFIPEGSTVYFAPDGILHLLAIEYLPSVNNGKYELHRLTTTALLAEKKNRKKETKNKSLVVGGMDYDYIAPIDTSGSYITNQDAFRYLSQNRIPVRFSYLPGSKVESDSIINYLTGVDKHEDIDESLLKGNLSNYGKVHLATHGYSWQVDVPSVPYLYRDSITEDKSLLASGIALSGANKLYLFPLRDDGLLSARELCEMDLNSVDLVVASSCQSAQGRVSDEGPTGLVRGLKKAGVRTIIASLWPVSDKATMLLMQFFYEEWREGKGNDGKGCSKTRALHMAQERLRKVEGNPVTIRSFNSSHKTGEYKTVTTKYDSPYYWAPFIIIDDI